MTTTEDTTVPESMDAEESMPLVSKKYEIMVIISSLISDEDIKQRLKGLKDLLGGDIVYEEIWGMRPFAFPIKKQAKGYYVVRNFMSDADGIKELEESLKLYPDLLRHLIMKVPEDYKPMTLPEIEAGLEELRKKKAEKRGQTKSAVQKRTDKAAAPKADAPAAKKEETPEAETPAAEAKKEETEAKKESKDDKNKTLDEKLDDILSDADLGL